MEKYFKTIIASSVILVSLSIFYALVIKPYNDDAPYRKCMGDGKSSADGCYVHYRANVW